MKKNHPPCNTKSNSSLSTAFNNGGLLSHPSGIQKFKQESQIIHEQRQRLNDIAMLRRPPSFHNNSRNSDEIDSEIENVPSSFKRYGEKKVVGWVNGRKKITILSEYRVGEEFSQLESQLQDQGSMHFARHLNPQVSVAQQKNPNLNLFGSNGKEQQKSFKANSGGGSSHIQSNKEQSQNDQPVDPDFLAYLSSLSNQKNP